MQIQKEIAEKKVNLGNPGLTALWNLHPDNLEACRAKDRDFLPSLENYFVEALDRGGPVGCNTPMKEVGGGRVQ